MGHFNCSLTRRQGTPDVICVMKELRSDSNKRVLSVRYFNSLRLGSMLEEWPSVDTSGLVEKTGLNRQFMNTINQAKIGSGILYSQPSENNSTSVANSYI